MLWPLGDLEGERLRGAQQTHGSEHLDLTGCHLGIHCGLGAVDLALDLEHILEPCGLHRSTRPHRSAHPR